MDNAMTSNDKFNDWSKKNLGLSNGQAECQHEIFISESFYCKCGLDRETVNRINICKIGWDARGKYDV